MNEVEFNLLDEPWIRVRTENCQIHEVSLNDLFIHSHEYVDFAGELEAQDIAILRLCLAVMHTVFYRYDAEGNENRLDGSDMALERWEDLWQMGHFPADIIRDYLTKYRERFWLFHPEKPFFQVNEAKKGTEYTAAKLNGEISESSNKIRMFAMRCKEGKEQLTYAEAARWLLFINGFDDTSAKPRESGLPSPGAGWLGKLGIIQAVGHNIFETLMLNFVLDREGDKWSDNHPLWELEPRTEERTEIAIPDNPAQLLTLQSRRLLLIRKGEYVVGYYLLGGDFFTKINAFAETMTAWSKNKSKGAAEEFQPKRHDPEKQMWREFGNIFFEQKGQSGTRFPGVVDWIHKLRTEGCLDDADRITFRSVSVQYGDKDFFIADTFNDSITLHTDLLKEENWIDWGDMIIEEVKKCDELAGLIKELARELSLSAGMSSSGEKEKAEFYSQIDIPFRKWIEVLNPQSVYDGEKSISDIRIEWHRIASKTAKGLGQKLIGNIGTAALVGRTVIDKDRSWYCCAPKAYNRFLYRLGSIYSD